MRHYPLSAFASALTSVGLLLAAPTAANAQNSTSRAIVQPLPSPEVERLNTALKTLARRPRNLDALIEAGNASLRLDDLDAAIGFFGRAEELSPNNPRVKMGQGAVYLRSGRPIEALRLFAEAEEAGASSRDVLADRGLAYDMVGDQTRAMAMYRQALSQDPDNNLAIRRMALSQAIVGEQRAFEDTLRPLIDKRDFAAFRTRAFGLAIMGEQDRAAAITEAVMPRDLAARITPYLEYMPRLTKAQQAAAANLGIFPRAAEIGRDDPRIAAFAAGNSGTASSTAELAAGDRLEPAGEPLGQTTSRVASASPAAAAESPTPTIAVADTVPGPGFDLSRVEGSDATSSATPEPDFADAFGEMGSSELPDAKASGDSVNLATIEAPREAPPAAAPAEPEHPRRIWVQVATGRDREALRFDWRRISRQASRLLRDYKPHVVEWGQSNRLLAGPIEGTREARELVNALSERGIDTFSYTSPEGTEIQELN